MKLKRVFEIINDKGGITRNGPQPKFPTATFVLQARVWPPL